MDERFRGLGQLCVTKSDWERQRKLRLLVVHSVRAAIAQAGRRSLVEPDFLGQELVHRGEVILGGGKL
jgi:hypothetical protein